MMGTITAKKATTRKPAKVAGRPAATPSKSAAGRKTVWTPAVEQKLLQALREGCTRRAACAYAGIGESTLYDHLSQLPEFSESLTRAEDAAEAGFTLVIQKAAADGDWKAAESWLKRRRRTDWGDKVEQEISGKDGGPIEVKAIDYRTSLAAVAPGSVGDSEAPGQD